MYECVLCGKAIEEKRGAKERIGKLASDKICEECVEMLRGLSKYERTEEYIKASRMAMQILDEVGNDTTSYHHELREEASRNMAGTDGIDLSGDKDIDIEAYVKRMRKKY